jgi:hypothetical protein
MTVAGYCKCGQPYLQPIEGGETLIKARAIIVQADGNVRMRCLKCKGEIVFRPVWLKRDR